jgi:2-succinyl-5-enolpyruvyl-6-hydroxy-3-cyclohexene-1-carboxylate synthase
MTQVAQYTFPQDHANINLLWSSLFIEELTRHGITDFCLAPGSRSTPLTLAVAQHPLANTHVHFDERGLGFLALGLSQSTSKPVVLITTSGTAVANLYPAIIEARQSKIPLIIISADRPPELINCSANQAIDQNKIFSDYPVYFQQLPSPTKSINSNFLLTSLNQGLLQQQINPGPIHFNMAIPEPFYPTNKLINFETYLNSLKNWNKEKRPFTVYHQDHYNSSLASKIDLNAEKILVVVGRIKDKQQALAIQQGCEQHNLLLFADVQSQLQGSQQNLQGYDLLLEHETFKQLISEADLIVQFSDHLISKRLNQLISTSQADLWEVSEHSQLIDPSHCVKQRFVTRPSEFIKQIINSKKVKQDWLNNAHQYKTTLTAIIHPYLVNETISEINSCAYLLNEAKGNIVLGNSLAIRLADMFAQTRATIYSNRGASGIDGLLATAIGIAKKSDTSTSLLIGDASFLYDLNSLALLTQLKKSFIIILLNNDGGGIFNLLPVPILQLREFYQNPHGLTFKKTCEQFSINYYQPATFSDFKLHYQQALSENDKTTLIEVCINNQLTPTQLQTIKNEVKNAVIL